MVSFLLHLTLPILFTWLSLPFLARAPVDLVSPVHSPVHEETIRGATAVSWNINPQVELDIDPDTQTSILQALQQVRVILRPQFALPAREPVRAQADAGNAAAVGEAVEQDVMDAGVEPDTGVAGAEEIVTIEIDVPPRISPAGRDFIELETDLFTNRGVMLDAPVDWDVSPGRSGTLFDMAIPGMFFVGYLAEGGNADVAGPLAALIFRYHPHLLIEEIDPDGAPTGIEEFYTVQGLPVAKITYDAEFLEVEARGAVYVLSPGDQVYTFVTIADAAVWADLNPTLDAVVHRLTFEESLVKMATTEAGRERVVDRWGTMALTLPPGWKYMPTDDLLLPLYIMDPSSHIFGSVGTNGWFAARGAANILDVAAINPDEPVDVTSLVANVVDLLGMTVEEFVLDQAGSEVFVRDQDLTIRMMGSALFGAGVAIPQTWYINLNADRTSLALLHGDADVVLSHQREIIEILRSVGAPGGVTE